MKCLILIERWKEDDKLIRKTQYELFVQGLQLALYIFEKKGLPLDLNLLWNIDEKQINNINSNKGFKKQDNNGNKKI